MLTLYRLALALPAWAWFRNLPQPWPLTVEEIFLRDLLALALLWWACRAPARLLAKSLARAASHLVNRRQPEERDPWRGTRVTPRRLPG